MKLKKLTVALILSVFACEGEVVDREGKGRGPKGLSPLPDLPSIEDSPDDRDPTGAGGSASGTGGQPASGGAFGSGGSGVPGSGGDAASGGASVSTGGSSDLGGAAGAGFGGMGGDTPGWLSNSHL